MNLVCEVTLTDGQRDACAGPGVRAMYNETRYRRKITACAIWMRRTILSTFVAGSAARVFYTVKQ